MAALGTLVGLAGVEHGVGEILQGPVRPEGLVIESWPDAAALEILAGEPAMTVVPNLLATGLWAVAVGVLVVVSAVGIAARRRGGLLLIGLSVLLLLVGGGLAPPVMGVILGGVALRIGSLPRRSPGGMAPGFGRLWPWFLAVAVTGYLALMPGMLVFHALGVASEPLVAALGVFAFTSLGLALAAARAHDRVAAAVERSRS